MKYFSYIIYRLINCVYSYEKKNIRKMISRENDDYKTIRLHPRISELSKRPNTSKELLGFFLPKS